MGSRRFGATATRGRGTNNASAAPATDPRFAEYIEELRAKNRMAPPTSRSRASYFVFIRGG